MSYFITYRLLQLMFLVLMEEFSLISRESYQSLFLKMPVKAAQYRVAMRIFNSWNLIINLRFELLLCSKLSNNLLKHDPNYISLLLYIFLSAFLFSKGYISKVSTKLSISIFLLFNILLGVLVWLCSCLIILSIDFEVNPGSKTSFSECLSSTAYQPMAIPNYFFWKHIYQFINLIFVSQKHILILMFSLIMILMIWQFVGIIWYQTQTFCLYCKNYLPLRVLNISYLKECLNFGLKIDNQSCNFVVHYRSPS